MGVKLYPFLSNENYGAQSFGRSPTVFRMPVSPSPRLSRLPISNPRGERSVCEPSVPDGRPRAERAISDGLGRGT